MIGHEHEEVVDVNGFDKPGKFVLEMVYNYGVSFQQLAALADISTQCRQYVKVSRPTSKWDNTSIYI